MKFNGILSLSVVGRHNDSRLQHTATPSLCQQNSLTVTPNILSLAGLGWHNDSRLQHTQEAKCSQADEQLRYREKSALKNVYEIYVFTLATLLLQ